MNIKERLDELTDMAWNEGAGGCDADEEEAWAEEEERLVDQLITDVTTLIEMARGAAGEIGYALVEGELDACVHETLSRLKEAIAVFDDGEATL